MYMSWRCIANKNVRPELLSSLNGLKIKIKRQDGYHEGTLTIIKLYSGKPNLCVVMLGEIPDIIRTDDTIWVWSLA